MVLKDLLLMTPEKRAGRVLYEKKRECLSFLLEPCKQYEEECSPLGFIILLKKPGEEQIAGFRISRLRELLALPPKERLDSLQVQYVTLFCLIRDWLVRKSQTIKEEERINITSYFVENSFLDKAEQAAGGYTLLVPHEDAEHILFYLAPL